MITLETSWPELVLVGGGLMIAAFMLGGWVGEKKWDRRFRELNARIDALYEKVEWIKRTYIER